MDFLLKSQECVVQATHRHVPGVPNQWDCHKLISFTPSCPTTKILYAVFLFNACYMSH